LLYMRTATKLSGNHDAQAAGNTKSLDGTNGKFFPQLAFRTSILIRCRRPRRFRLERPAAVDRFGPTDRGCWSTGDGWPCFLRFPQEDGAGSPRRRRPARRFSPSAGRWRRQDRCFLYRVDVELGGRAQRLKSRVVLVPGVPFQC
jgi:hypothetical protein